MKLLISKRQANLALFLSLACEEIRMFGVFEEVSLICGMLWCKVLETRYAIHNFISSTFYTFNFGI